MPLPIPTPPADAAGGYFTYQYLTTDFRHVGRMHIAAFNASTLAYTTPTATEVVVGDTVAALFSHLKTLYISAWQFSFVQLWHNTAGVFSEVFPGPTVAAVNGTLAGNVADYLPENEVTLSARSVLGGKFKLITLGQGDIALVSFPAVVSGSSGLDGQWQGLAGYLNGANTQIRAHDGGGVITNFHATATLNRRLRRHYQHA